MVQVPQLGGNNQGNLLAIQAILRGGEYAANAKARGGAAIARGLSEAGTGIALRRERKLTRAERAKDRTAIEADRAEGRRMQQARLNLALVQADLGILKDQRERAETKSAALRQRASLNPTLLEDPDFKREWLATQGDLEAIDESTATKQADIQTMKSRPPPSRQPGKT